MAKSSGGTRAAGASSGTIGANSVVSSSSPKYRQMANLRNIAKSAGISEDYVKDDGGRYVTVGTPRELPNGWTHSQVEYRKDVAEIRMTSDNTIWSHVITIRPTTEGKYSISEGGNRPNKLNTKEASRKQVVEALKKFKEYYKR